MKIFEKEDLHVEMENNPNISHFQSLKEIQSIDKLVLECLTIIKENEKRIAFLKNNIQDKEEELSDFESEFKQLTELLVSENKINLSIGNEIIQTKKNYNEIKNDNQLKAYEEQIKVLMLKKENSDEALFTFLIKEDEIKTNININRSFISGAKKSFAQIETESNGIIKLQLDKIDNYNLRINLIKDTLPDNFKSKFELVYKKLKHNTPITVLDKNLCFKCNIAISGTEIDLINNANSLEICPQCGRILLPALALS